MLKLHTTRSIEENSVRKLDQVLNKSIFSDVASTSKKRKTVEIPKTASLGIVRKRGDAIVGDKKPKLICNYSSSSNEDE
jgi:hypothetical protein